MISHDILHSPKMEASIYPPPYYSQAVQHFSYYNNIYWTIKCALIVRHSITIYDHIQYVSISSHIISVTTLSPRSGTHSFTIHILPVNSPS